MKGKTLFSILATAALGIVMAAPAYADALTFTWKSDAGTDVFRTANNWDGGIAGHRLPVAGDKAIIQSTTNGNDPVISNDEAFALLTINSSGKLTITGTNTVTISGSSHRLNGDLVLQDSGSIVKFTGGTVTASGTSTTGIKGENNGAEIQIEGGDTLTSTMLIQGKMIIKTDGGTGNGTFVNGSTGIVRADLAGTLLLAADLTLSNCSDAVWEASTNSSAILRFNEDATGLTGLFYLDDCATIQLGSNVDIATTNTLTNGSGGAAKGFLDFVGSGSFSYRDQCDGNKTTWNADHTFGSCP